MFYGAQRLDMLGSVSKAKPQGDKQIDQRDRTDSNIDTIC